MDKIEKLVDYLYDEMTDPERLDFENRLASDPELKAELEALQQTRQRLVELPDLEPVASVVPRSPASPQWKKWVWRASIAAAFLLLLNLFGIRLEINSGGVVLAMGSSVDNVDTKAVEKQVTISEIHQILEQRDREWSDKLIRLDSSWQNRLTTQEELWRDNWQKQFAGFEARQTEEINRLAQQWRDEEIPQIANLIQNLQLQQQRELDLMLSEFWTQWQETRAADLQSIQNEFVHLYRNVEQTQSETQAVLKDLKIRGNL